MSKYPSAGINALLLGRKCLRKLMDEPCGFEQAAVKDDRECSEEAIYKEKGEGFYEKVSSCIDMAGELKAAEQGIVCQLLMYVSLYEQEKML